MSRRARAACGVVLAALAGCALWTHLRAARAERAFPPAGRFVEVDGLRLHVLERGAGPPVVLLHGAFGGAEDWDATVLDAIARTHRALAFDRPGHGWSERPADAACGPLEQARILRSALAELGVERPLLVGFSWGGALALAWAVEWPDEVAGVLLVNPVAYPWPGAVDVEYVLAGLPGVGPLLAHTLVAPLGALAQRSAVARTFAPAPIAASFERSPLPLALRPEQFLAEAQDMRLLKRALAMQCSRYGEVRAPVEILAGCGDVVAWWEFHSARLAHEVPGAALAVVDGAGHQIPHSHPGALLSAFRRLAARADDARGR